MTCPECKEATVAIRPGEGLTIVFECACQHSWIEEFEDDYDFLGRVIEIFPIGVPGSGRFGR